MGGGAQLDFAQSASDLRVVCFPFRCAAASCNLCSYVSPPNGVFRPRFPGMFGDNFPVVILEVSRAGVRSAKFSA